MLTLGCAGAEPGPDALGDMSDRSYDRARGTTSGDDAEGQPLGVDDFEGGFVWVEHTAPWCPACRTQAPILARIASDTTDVSFLVLLTATDDPFQAPTVATAKAWASRYRHEPDLVVAKYRNDTRAIPQHRLFSPDGQLLFYGEGQLPEQRIREVLEERIPEWEEWNRSGDEARWMR